MQLFFSPVIFSCVGDRVESQIGKWLETLRCRMLMLGTHIALRRGGVCVQHHAVP